MAAGSSTLPNNETVSLKLPTGEMVDAIVPAGLSDDQVKIYTRMKRPDLFGAPAAAARPPIPQMQPSNLATALGSGNSGVANPQQPAEQFAIQNPDQQGRLATAAGIGAAGTGAVAGARAAATAMIPPVLKIGQWAKDNPAKAYIIYDQLRAHLPWFRDAADTIKKVPTSPK